MVEVGMGHSGRYVGNDDDEFEKLVGSGQQNSSAADVLCN